MKKILLISIACLLLMARFAVGQDVDFTFDDAANFSKFKTYKWVEVQKAGDPIDKLTGEQIKATVDAALAKKGLTKVDSDSADLSIDYRTRERISEENPKNDVDDQPLILYEGSLAIEMYTPAKHHLVWMGVARKALDPNANAEKRQENLTKAVAKLMQNYPPPK